MRKRGSSFPFFSELKVLPQQYLFIFYLLRTFLIKSGNFGTTDLTNSAISIYRQMFIGYQESTIRLLSSLFSLI